MYKPTVLLICLLLLTSHVNTQCQNSNIRGMASGIINLGLPTNATAPETFSQSLAGANLGLQAEVFHSLGNLVWAGTYGISDVTTTTTDSALLVNSVFSAQPGTQFADITCGYLNTSPPAFDLDCGLARTNARFMVHPYIMGFRFNPIGGTHTLAASVLLGDGGSTQTRAVN